ncbi:MAG: hypothetical protein JSU69_05450 [Candidatus Zixiibacteriota bacterium]|nr:MAG: hypothetical protein JSU69_05450 [candidate division Zixibacteria bacterium]
MLVDYRVNLSGFRDKPLRMWPYLVLILVALVYNYAFLDQGYSAVLDEGFLQVQAKRILSGQRLYFDFYYLKPPLPIYIQAGLIALWGDAYDIMTARIFLVLQLLTLVIVWSLLYRRFVKSWELCLLLLMSYIVVSLLLSFPWYSYDGVFFTTIGALFFVKKRYLLSGFMIFLATMCKQNYFLVIPLVIVMLFVVRVFVKSAEVTGLASIPRMLAGFLLPAAIYAIYLQYQGGWEVFFYNIYSIPREFEAASLAFTVYQDIPTAVKSSFPLLAAIIVSYYIPKSKWPLAAVVLGILIFFGYDTVTVSKSFIYFLICLNYTITILWLIEYRARHRDTALVGTKDLPILVFLALIIQYMACFNFGGLFFSYMGAAMALPFSYILLRNYAYSPYRKIIAVALLLLVIAVSLFHKYSFVYHDAPRHHLTAEFGAEKLAGIKSTPRNVRHVEGILSTIDSLSEKGDYIFVFPDYAPLYYLADRKNPAPVDWFYKVSWYSAAEAKFGIIAESVRALQQNKPKIILTNSTEIPEQLRAFIEKEYEQIKSINEISVFTHKKELPAQGSERTSKEPS